MSKDYEKLKIEHARYARALKFICHDYADDSDAYRHADGALNPPTIVELCAALRELKSRQSRTPSITFFGDESGRITNGPDTVPNTFLNLREALDFLKGGSHE